MKFWLPGGILVVLILALIIHQPKPSPCGLKAPACIKITEGNGEEFRFNDFRFLPNHCISFTSLPDKLSRKYCGNYKLDWIGPVPTQEK